MEYSEILYEEQGKIAILTLNRPDIRNAINDRLIPEILDALGRVPKNDAICVLIVTGAGTAFSAGGDLKAMNARTGMFEGDPGRLRENYRSGLQQIPLAFKNLDVPTIAAVNGPAIGAGCDIACMCDIRIAGEKARFGVTFLSLGLVPGDGGAFFLPRVVGFSKALELAFTCRVIDVAEAYRIGLVSEVVSPDNLMKRSMEIASEIARQPARSLRMAKRLFYSAREKSLEETLELSAAYQALCHHMPEHAEALEALFANQRSGSCDNKG
ncbi:MAG: enoyl-CoA hydratase-related protein [Syntrophobacteraceae bacterium]